MTGTVVITGGCGFLGAALAMKIMNDGVTLPNGRRLASGAVHLWDRPGAAVPDVPGVRFTAVDVADAAAVADAMPADTALIYHLAAVVSGQAEADYDLAMRVNLGGTTAVLAAARNLGPDICVVGTSSLAVYGSNAVEPLTEATPIQPQNTYGVTKAMAELVMADHRRRRWVDARTLRLPTVTVRPGRPNAAASSFASSIIREPLAGLRAVCPVDPDLPMWIASPAAAVRALYHAPSVPAADWPGFGAINVPGIRVTVAQMLDTLGHMRDLVDMAPDARIAGIVQSWPALFDTALAQALGFVGDTGFADIYRQAQAVTRGPD